MSILDKVRKFIDGDTAELALEQAARDAQVKPRSRAEEFIVMVARSVERVMQDEMVPLPQGTTIIPSQYIIFLSEIDDSEWRGVKRRGLIQGLNHVLAERAAEIAGKKKLDTKSFTIEIRVDATLPEGEVRIEHGWEDANADKTGVLRRPPALDQPQPIADAQPQARAPQPIQNIMQAEPIAASDGELMTKVNPRTSYLYRLEIWRDGVRQTVIPVSKNEIVIGRGSRSKPVDVPLTGDVEVSRRHLSIQIEEDGSLWVVNEGKNPAQISNVDLPSGQRVRVRTGTPINVCSYTLRIDA